MKYMYYYWQDLYTPTELIEIEKYCLANESKIYSDRPAGDKKNVDAFVFDIPKKEEKFDILFERVMNTNHQFFGFDIFDYYLRQGNYNNYEGEKNEYKFHRDAADPQDLHDIKLTAILNISNEEYEGGDFIIYDGDHRIVDEIKTPGNLLVFPSFYYHAVTPVTKGCRKTISFWFRGPVWK